MKREWLFGLVLASVPAMAAAQGYVYPKQGQSQQQMQQDQAECRTWASQQPTASSPSQGPGPLRGAARGALLGGAVGGLTDKDAGDTAAAGAAVGGLGSTMRRRDERRAQAQEAPERAFAACMEGRGYSVR